jgi:hypothetical protein
MKRLAAKFSSQMILVASAALLLSTAAFAQEPSSDSAPPPPPGHGAMRGPGFSPGPFRDRMELLGIGGMHGKVVTGAPFSAAATAETKQTLSDGTTISRTMQTTLFRDAQGRVRREVTMPGVGPLAASGTPRTFIMIQDPVAGAGYMLDPSKKVAHKMPQHAHGGPGGDSPDAAQTRTHRGDNANVIKESLGTQTINGVSAQGTRYTRTIPAGQVGNDKPLTIVKEEWYSPDLQIVVQSKHSDPFTGTATYTVTNIQRTAPNATLFSVPSGYTVSDVPIGDRGGKRRHGPGAPPPVPSTSDAPAPGM